MTIFRTDSFKKVELLAELEMFLYFRTRNVFVCTQKFVRSYGIYI